MQVIHAVIVTRHELFVLRKAVLLLFQRFVFLITEETTPAELHKHIGQEFTWPSSCANYNYSVSITTDRSLSFSQENTPFLPRKFRVCTPRQMETERDSTIASSFSNFL